MDHLQECLLCIDKVLERLDTNVAKKQDGPPAAKRTCLTPIKFGNSKLNLGNIQIREIWRIAQNNKAVALSCLEKQLSV